MHTDDHTQPATIFLARHGQSEYNARHLVTGQLDPSLSAKGQRQARELAQVLRRQPLAAIYSSPLTRTLDTARPTAAMHGLPIQPRAALAEIHLGILQGRCRDASDPAAQQLWALRQNDKWHYRVPGGETLSELAQRVLPCLQDLLVEAAGQCILIVGHRNVNRLLLGALLHYTPEATLTIQPRSQYLYAIVPGTVPQVTTIILGKASCVGFVQ